MDAGTRDGRLMSITRVRRIPCRECGRPIEAVTIESANLMRHPHFQQQLLDRRLLRIACPRCGAEHLHFDRFMWTDLPGRFCAIVVHESERHDWARLEPETHDAIAIPFAEGPPIVRELGQSLSIRLVFGLDELREKVTCRIHSLDDRFVEALKVDLPYGSSLETVTDEGRLIFDDGNRHVEVAREHYDAVTARRAELAPALPGIFDPGAAWVSALRAHRAPWTPPLAAAPDSPGGRHH
jgi:CpXC protein